jgi:hypothetical protein
MSDANHASGKREEERQDAGVLYGNFFDVCATHYMLHKSRDRFHMSCNFLVQSSAIFAASLLCPKTPSGHGTTSIAARHGLATRLPCHAMNTARRDTPTVLARTWHRHVAAPVRRDYLSDTALGRRDDCPTTPRPPLRHDKTIALARRIHQPGATRPLHWHGASTRSYKMTAPARQHVQRHAMMAQHDHCTSAAGPRHATPRHATITTARQDDHARHTRYPMSQLFSLSVMYHNIFHRSNKMDKTAVW